MQPLKLFLVGSSGIIGLGVPVTWGSHEFTKETIWDQVSEDAIPNDKDASVNREA